MSGIALNGSTIAQSTKSGHVTYKIEKWQYIDQSCTGWYNEHGVCQGWRDNYDWVPDGSGSTGAKISGTVSASSNVYINGVPVATTASHTNETWVADPPIPSSNASFRYTATSPISGSGNGSIPNGNSSNVYINGNKIAQIGSSVTTNLENSTTISSGSSNVFIG